MGAGGPKVKAMEGKEHIEMSLRDKELGVQEDTHQLGLTS